MLPKNIDDLRPAPYNPRSITDRQRRGLSHSIAKFGDLSGITYNSRTGHLVTGHQRVEILRESGGTYCPDKQAIVSGGEVFPVKIVALEESEEKAANVAANSQHISGEYTDGLRPILDSLRDEIGDDFESLNLSDFFSAEHVDADAEWVGMPEFKQDDISSYQTVKVHFGSKEDVDNFCAMTGQAITPKTKFIYIPPIEEQPTYHCSSDV